MRRSGVIRNKSLRQTNYGSAFAENRFVVRRLRDHSVDSARELLRVHRREDRTSNGLQPGFRWPTRAPTTSSRSTASAPPTRSSRRSRPTPTCPPRTGRRSSARQCQRVRPSPSQGTSRRESRGSTKSASAGSRFRSCSGTRASSGSTSTTRSDACQLPGGAQPNPQRWTLAASRMGGIDPDRRSLGLFDWWHDSQPLPNDR